MTQRCQYIVFNKNKILLANMPNKWHFWHICHQCRNAVRTPFASFLTSTGCKRWIQKIFEFKIWKKPILVLKQTIPQQKTLIFSFKMTAWVFDVLPSTYDPSRKFFKQYNHFQSFLLKYRVFQYKHLYFPNFELKYLLD